MLDSTVSTPFGLRPVRYMDGSAYNGACHLYYSSENQIIGIGDLVKLSGTADSTGLVQGVSIATAGAAAIGVVVGIAQVTPGHLPASLAANSGFSQKLYKAAAATEYLWVCDDPKVIYQIREDGDGESTVVASVGLNANIVKTSDASTTTGLSGMHLDSSSKATTATLNLHIHGLSFCPSGKNVISAAGAAGNYAVFDVSIVGHSLSPNAAGV
jgi:hypothetical protein